MKIRIEKPGGHSLIAEGRTKDVQTLVNVWWGATPQPERNPVGFQVEKESKADD